MAAETSGEAPETGTEANEGNGRLMLGVRRPEIIHTCPATRKPVRPRAIFGDFELRTRKQPVRKRNEAVSRRRCSLDADEGTKDHLAKVGRARCPHRAVSGVSRCRGGGTPRPTFPPSTSAFSL